MQWVRPKAVSRERVAWAMRPKPRKPAVRVGESAVGLSWGPVKKKGAKLKLGHWVGMRTGVGGGTGTIGLTFPSLTKVTPAPALRPAMRASITVVSATLRDKVDFQLVWKRRAVVVLTCFGENIWSITKSHLPSI